MHQTLNIHAVPNQPSRKVKGSVKVGQNGLLKTHGLVV